MIKKLVYINRYFYAFLKKYKLLIFGSSIIGVALLLLFNILTKYSLASKKENVGILGKYHINNIPIIIQDKISSGLTYFDENYIVKCDLCEKWESEDGGKVYKFSLKNELYWHDGTKIKTTDLNYNFNDVKTEIIDDRNIKFSLENPFSPFPSVLSKPIFKKGLIGMDENKAINAKLSGGFITNLTISNENRNKVTYKFYPTQESLLNAFKLGKIDRIIKLSDIKSLSDWKNLNISTEVDYNQIVTIFFNTKSEIFLQKEFRLGFLYLINKERFFNRAISPISPNSWSYNPSVKDYKQDIERAKALLKNESEKQSKLTINFVTTPILLDTAELIASDLRAGGINVNLMVSSIIPTEFDVYLAIYDSPKDPDQYSLWHSTQSATNLSRYSNPRIDKLLEDGRSTTDQEERKKIYLDFQRYLVEDSPAGFLYHPTYYEVTRK